MKTLILPGFSSKNKEWAQEAVENVKDDISFISWPHWESGEAEANWIEKEVDRIEKTLNNEKINIISKSVGTIVAAALIKKNKNVVNKIILCGIPIADFKKGDVNIFTSLKEITPQNILSIQNDNDPSSDLESVKKLLNSINENITVNIKTASSHHYPYYEDFKSFL